MVWKGRTWEAKTFAEKSFDLSRPVARPAPRVDEVWLVGDSRVEMWPAAELPAAWHIQNFGRSGWTTGEIKSALADALSRAAPRMIILQAGINDIQGAGYRPENLPAAAETAARHFAEMASLCREAGTPLVFTSTLPRGPRTLRDRWFWTAEMDAAAANLNDSLAKLAGPGVYYADLRPAVCDSENLVQSRFALDTLHLNPAGYTAVSPALVAFCQDKLK